MRMRRLLGIKALSAVTIGVCAVLVALLVAVAPTGAVASPASLSPVGTGSGSCSAVAGDGGITGTAPAPTTEDVLAEVQVGSGDTGVVETNSFGDGDFGSGDTVWVDDGTVDAGSYPTLSFYGCTGTGSVNVQFFAEPAAPVTYSGSSTYENGPDEVDDDDYQASSIMPFVSSSTGPYEATVSVTQGAVELDISGILGAGAKTPVTSSDTIPLGDLTSGQSYDLALDALDGPQADWTVSIAPVPVAISGVGVSPTAGPGGTPVTISYTVSGDTSLDAGVYNTSGKLVDSLAAGLAVSQGKHTLTWGGTGANGAALMAGTYRVKLTSTDTQGNVSTGSAAYAIPPLKCSQNVARSAVAATPLGHFMERIVGPATDSRDWFVDSFYCHEFTGQPDMIVQFGCCTADSNTPLGIFRDIDNRWKLSYSWSGVSYDLRIQGRSLIESRPVYTKNSPGLCCAAYNNYWALRWNGKAFVAKRVGRSKTIHYKT
jgi:hypothetical protein